MCAIKYRQQLDESDCGAACLAMIASFFGKNLSIAQVRDLAGTDIEGTNFKGLLEASKKYGLKAKAVKGESSSITSSLPIPFIAHMHIQRSQDDWIDHYVVVRRITKKRIEIWDPDPLYKKQKVSYPIFLDWWTGYAIFFEPTIGFNNSDKKGNLLLEFLPVFLPHTKTLLFSFIASVLLLSFGILISFYYKYVFDEIIYSKSSFSLHTLTIGILIVIIIQTLVETIRNVLLSHFSYKSDLQLNFSYLSHIFNLPLSFFESRKSGEILSRLGDLDKIKQTLSSAALSGIMDVIMLIASGPILFNINSKLFGVSIATVVIAAVISVIYARIYKSFYSKSMSQNAEVQSFLYESLNGVATIKALNAEEIVNMEYEKKKMTAINTDWKLNRYGISQGLVSGLVNGISGILIYWIGCSAIISGSMSFGTLITFNSLLGYFTGPLFRLINIQNQVQEAFVAAERVGEILNLKQEKDDSIQNIKPQKIRGHIIFDDVTFSYGNRQPIYDHFSIEISPGSWTALVGPSGSGKTTFAKLIMKFYETKKGRIIIDGKDIRDIDTASIRNQIGYVPQEIFLFSGTIRENITLHNPSASFEEIIEAAKKSGAHDFIEKLPKRYDTILGEHGGGLSGGEKQRLALARALLSNPSFIILDEATSNLDSLSEMEIHKVIRQLCTDKVTVILIAHRLSTVTDCDKIYVLKDGKIKETGNHMQLLEQNGLYSEMWHKML